MGEGKRNNAIICVKEDDNCWENKEGDYDNSDTTSQTLSNEDSSTTSNESSSSSSVDTADDDASSSSTSYSSSSSSTGPLYDLSDLMSQLPIKRGLSKYYHGKSQSYTSLSSVRSIEDLAKKEVPYRRKMKGCKSYQGGLDGYKSYTLPKPIIQKKSSRGSLMASSCCRPPLIPVQKNIHDNLVPTKKENKYL